MKYVIILVLIIVARNNCFAQNFDIKYLFEISSYLYQFNKESIKINVGLLNRNGELLTDGFTDGILFPDGKANIIKDDEFGYLNFKNEMNLFPEFKGAIWQGDIGIAFKEDRLHALIDLNGNQITEFKYQRIDRISSKYFFVFENGKSNYINSKGQKIFNDSIELTNHGIYNSVAVYKSKNNKFGLINCNGRYITEPIYDLITGDINSLYWSVFMNNLEGVIDCDGNLIIPIENKSIELFSHLDDKLFPVMKNDSYGYVDTKNRLIIPYQYESASTFRKGKAIVKENGIWKVIDKKNKLLTQLDYEPINTRRNFLSEGLVIFKNDKKYGFINLKGKVIIEAIYEEALPFKDGLAKVKLNNKYGFINTKGQVVIKIEYDYLSDMIENRVLFKNK
jgi:hypothetical protein